MTPSCRPLFPPMQEATPGPVATHDFSALLRAVAALSSVRGLAQFDAAIASLMLDAIPAVAVALHGDAGLPTHFRSAWTLTATSDPVRIDSDLIDRAARERKAFVVGGDGATDNGAHATVAPHDGFRSRCRQHVARGPARDAV